MKIDLSSTPKMESYRMERKLGSRWKLVRLLSVLDMSTARAAYSAAWTDYVQHMLSSYKAYKKDLKP